VGLARKALAESGRSRSSWLREKYPDLPSLLQAIRRRPGMLLG
jgi:hypothetical protein